MRILIVNLIKDDKKVGIIEKITGEYRKLERDAEIKIIDLGKESFKDCLGCFGCWVKTPGVCVHKDAMPDFYREYLKSDRAVLLLETAQGFLTGNNKAFIDRLIPLYHPYIDIIKNEMMHRYRYEKYPEMDFYFESKSLSREEENVLEDYLFRAAYHFRVESRRIAFDGEGIKIRNLGFRDAKPEFLKKESCMENKGKVIIYNGSPRGIKGNSLILAKEVAKGLVSAGLKEADYEIRNLIDQKSHKLWAEDFKNHSRHIFVFPLYIHSMPSIVMKFFEQLRPLSRENHITFVVQSGFLESAQSHYLRPYLSLLVKRLGAAYGGTVIKGGVEGTQMKPEQANRKLFDNFNRLGREIMKNGAVSDALINELGDSAHLKKSMILIYKVISLTGLTNFIWNMQLKKNRAYKERFNKPYIS